MATADVIDGGNAFLTFRSSQTKGQLLADQLAHGLAGLRKPGTVPGPPRLRALRGVRRKVTVTRPERWPLIRALRAI